MGSYEYSEDNLIEQTAISLFQDQLHWETMLAYNAETFGESGTLGRVWYSPFVGPLMAFS